MSDNYPSDWNKRRKEVYRRDDFICQNCGVNGGDNGRAELHAHHIVPTSRGGSHKLSNLTTICKQCHKAVHNESFQAPSKEQKEKSLDPDDFEGENKDLIKIVNRMNELFSEGHNSGESISNLVSYIEKMFQYTDEPGDEVPHKLQEVYMKNHTKAKESTARSRKLLLEMRDIQSRNDFDKEFNSDLNDYIENCEEFVRTTAELLSTLDDIVTVDDEEIEIHVVSKDSIEWDVNLNVAKDEFIDKTDRLMNSKGSFEDSLNGYIN